MFKIYDGRETFYQWDINQKLIVADDSITEVHFSNRTDNLSLVRDIYNEGDLRVVFVPNVLLQTNWPIKVYAYRKDHTEVSETFKVIEKDKPEDYVYTPDEVKTWEELNNRVTELEKNGAESVLYTAQEPTEEQKAQARQNIGAQDLYNGLTPVSYSCTDGTYSVSDTVYLESGNIISPTDTVSNDVRIAFRFINFWNIPTQLDIWKNDIKNYKLLIDNGYLENNTIWYSKPDKKLKKQIRFGTNSKLGDYIVFNFNYDYEVIGQLVYYVDTDTISTSTDTYLNYNLKRDKNNVLSYSAIKLASDPTEPMQIATKQYVDNAPIKKASATELGGVKADSAEATDTQPVRIGGDGKLYTATGGTDISLGLTSAAVGQTIKVKAVDESGKPTEWEAAEMAGGESSFPKFEKLLTYTITDDDIAANVGAYIWNTTQIPNLNDFNVFTLTIRNPDNTTNITFTRWVRLKINNVLMGTICGTSQGASYRYSISANRLYGFWVSDNIYNPNNEDADVLTPPYLRGGFDSDLAASEAVTSIGFTSYNGGGYGLTAGIIVEIWGAK